MDSITNIRQWLTKRQGLIEEALRAFGTRKPDSMSQEEVVTWLGFKAQWGLIEEMMKEIIDAERKAYVKDRKKDGE